MIQEGEVLVDKTWFMEYDVITLTSGALSEDALTSLGTEFSGQKIQAQFPRISLDTEHYLINIGNGLKEIVKTLYNFFIVQQKLSNNDTIKGFFSSLVTFCKIQITYSELFFTKSQTFIYYRVMSCLLRQVRFYTYLYNKVQEYKGLMDVNFFDNMNEVYLYLLQKYGQILAYQTEALCLINVDKLQRLMVHLLNVLIIFFKYPVKQVILNEKIEAEYIQQILKYNMRCYQFKAEVQQDVRVQIDCEEEMDPVLLANLRREEQQYY